MTAARYLPGARRLYMTATLRIYDDPSKEETGQANAVLASMDDEAIFGLELDRLGFGEAVSRDLTSVSRTFQFQLADEGSALRLEDAAKIVGCWNGLDKRGDAEHSFAVDPVPMRRALAVAGTIKDSKRIGSLFAQTVEQMMGSVRPE